VSDTLRVAIAQMNSGDSIADSMREVEGLVGRAAAQGAKLLALPENATQLAPSAQRLAEAETLDGPQMQRIAAAAVAHDIAVLVGSFAERGPDAAHTFATTVVISRRGEQIGVYRKNHLFDVQVAADTALRESDTIAPGPLGAVVCDVDGWKLGLSICYDLRFPEHYRALVAGGAELLAVPAAFTFRTGAAHWEVLLRARAIENQCYVIAPAQVGQHYGRRESFGHAMAVDPWGTVLAQCGDRQEEGGSLCFADVMRPTLESVRQRLPCLEHRRV
jgi:predicted amidohydrolase